MNMKKRFFAWLLCIVMIFSFTLTAYAEGSAEVSVSGNDMEEPAVSEVNSDSQKEQSVEDACELCGEQAGHAADCLSLCTCGYAEEKHTDECVLFIGPLPICEYCGADLVEDAEHAKDCLSLCTCGVSDGPHLEGCVFYIVDVYAILMAADTVDEMYSLALKLMETAREEMNGMSTDELEDLYWNAKVKGICERSDKETYMLSLLQELAGEYDLGGDDLLRDYYMSNEYRQPLGSEYLINTGRPMMFMTRSRAAVQSNGVTVNKTVTEIGTSSATGTLEPVFRLDMTVTPDSDILVTADPIDIILVLDTSEQMMTEMSGEYLTNAALGAERLNGLKDAANSFIENAVSPLGERRIAIVEYNDASVIRSVNSAAGFEISERQDAALVPVNYSNAEYLKGIVNGLTLHEDTSANVDLGMNDARKIFQDGQNAGDTSRGNGAIPMNRPRIVVLLSAGMFGTGVKEMGERPNWLIAQRAINISAILKAPRTINAHPDNYGTAGNRVNGYNYGIDKRGGYFTVNNGWEACEFETWNGKELSTPLEECEKGAYTAIGLGKDADVKEFQGCGATIYCIGLSMPNTNTRWNGEVTLEGKSLPVLEYDAEKYPDGVYGSPASRINEMFYRVSSHRPDSTHPGYDPYNVWEKPYITAAAIDKQIASIEAKQITETFTAEKKAAQITEINTYYSNTVQGKFVYRMTNVADQSYCECKLQLADGYGPTRPEEHWTGIYTDQLTRNLADSRIFGVTYSFFMTTDEAKELKRLFSNVSTQMGIKVKDAVVKDYITEYFIPCSETGAPLQEGDTVCYNNDLTGTVRKDADGLWYVEWNNVPLDAGDENGNNVKSFNEKIYVKPAADFLGGDIVPTNDPRSGVYLISGETTRSTLFPEPDVDVAVSTIQPVFSTTDIYLSEDADIPAILHLGEFTQNGEKWIVDGSNNDYVNIVYTVEGPNGKTATFTIPAGTTSESLKDINWVGELDVTPFLTEDTGYTLSCVVTTDEDRVKTDTLLNQSIASKDETIHVYKPVILFNDSAVDWGQTVNYADNGGTDVVWKHGNTLATSDMGAAPELSYVYSFGGGSITEDTKVAVTVKGNAGRDITDDVTFYRAACSFEGCPNNTQTSVDAKDDNRVNFVIHLNPFHLLIQKSGASELDNNQSFLFRITGPDNFLMDVTVAGNGSAKVVSLPAAEGYKVTELICWAWRYELAEGTSREIEIDMNSLDKNGNTVDTITAAFTNVRKTDKWLSGDCFCENIFSGTTTGQDGTNSDK